MSVMLTLYFRGATFRKDYGKVGTVRAWPQQQFVTLLTTATLPPAALPETLETLYIDEDDIKICAKNADR
jgi:superfamily II DNA helicase RecQ